MLKHSAGEHHDPGGPDLERHVFWRGQHLTSRDLNDAGAGEEERQSWHNRAVHDAYGVVAGLAVLPAPPAATGVRVQPGLAYDAYGRELTVASATLVAPPRGVAEKPAPWALLLRSRANGCGCGCGRAGGPGPRVELFWSRAARTTIRDGVVLARGHWAKDGEDLLYRPEPGFRPLRARPLARPRLGRGHTPKGGTAWRTWTEVAFASATSDRVVATARGIEVTIDTAAAGFTRVPCYFAWLQGGLWQVSHRLALTAPLGRIVREARDRFTFSLWDPTIAGTAVIDRAAVDAGAAALARLLSLARQRLHVCWLGIEAGPAAFHATAPGPGAAPLPPIEPR